MPFTGGALAPDEFARGPAAPWIRYQTLRQGQPLLTPRGQPLRAHDTPVRRGYVRLTLVEGSPFSLDLLTTSEPYLLSESFAAGWTTIERTGKVDRPKWTRGALLRQAIPVILTTLKWPGLDIEDEWKALRHLARPPGGARPPAIRLAGPVDHKELRWTITNLDIDPDSTKRRGHAMVRQACTITVQQFSEAETEDTLTTVKAARDKPRKVLSTETLDTPRKIAKANGVTFKQLQQVNKGIGSDPDRKLKPKTTIWLPPASAIHDTSGALSGGARAPS